MPWNLHTKSNQLTSFMHSFSLFSTAIRQDQTDLIITVSGTSTGDTFTMYAGSDSCTQCRG